MISVKQIVNDSDSALGYQMTFKDKKENYQVEEKRIPIAVSKRPSQLRPSNSRASARGASRQSTRREGMSTRDGADSLGFLPAVLDRALTIEDGSNMQYLGIQTQMTKYDASKLPKKSQTL